MAGDGDEEEGEGEEEVAPALRGFLRQQALAVERLKAELEEERHAASSGADEALAMILRLQAEKAAERMEADQFRRMAEERILHDADSLAFLKAVVFHQEMDISSLKLRLLAVCGSTSGGPRAPPAGVGVDLPWLRKLAKNVVSSRRNASLPAARLEELCPDDLDAGVGDGSSREGVGGSTGPARTVSDIGEVLRMEEEWARSSASHLKAPPRLRRSASHRLRRAPSYPAQCGPFQHGGGGGVQDKFEAPESVASHAPPRSSRRVASPEIISEEDDQASSSASTTTRRADRDGQPKHDGDTTTTMPAIAELETAIHQITATVQNLATEVSKSRETTMVAGDAQARLLAEISAKLDAITTMNKNHHQDAAAAAAVAPGHGDEREWTSREVGSSSRSKSVVSVVSSQQSELLMNYFIEVCTSITFGMLFRFFLVLVLAVVLGKILVN